MEAAAPAGAGLARTGLERHRSGDAQMGRTRRAGRGEFPHRARMAAGGARAREGRTAGAGNGGDGQGFRHARPAADRRRRLGTGDAEARAPAAARLQKLGRVVPRRRARSGWIAAGSRAFDRTHVGRAQSRRDLPSARESPALLHPPLDVHAARSTARRPGDAAHRVADLRRVRTHGGVTGARSRRDHRDARWTVGSSALALLGRRTPGLGAKPRPSCQARPRTP